MGLIPTQLPFLKHHALYLNTTYLKNVAQPSSTKPGQDAITKAIASLVVSSAIKNYLDMASVVLALDVLSTTKHPSQIYTLYANFPSRTLEAIGFSDALVMDILCGKPLEDYIPVAAADVRDVRNEWVTGMWLQQTYIALGGRGEMLCGMLDVEGASRIFMNGTYAQEVLCGEIKGLKFPPRPSSSVTGFP